MARMMAPAAWLAILSSVLLFGQADAVRPAFEVASVKPGNPRGQLRPTVSSGGRLNGENVTLRALIEEAYQLKAFQLTKEPGWVDSETFEVIAKGDETAGPAQVRLMLQSLLAERFQLMMHSEMKELTISALTVKGTPKLQPAKEGGRFSMRTSSSGRGAGSAHVVFKNTSMALFADILSRQMGHMVEDQTKLDGEFDFELDADHNEAEPNPFVTELGSAISQAGLRLDSRKGLVEVFLVDHAEKPSAN